MSERMHVTTHFLQMHTAPEMPAIAPPADARALHTRDLSPTSYRNLYNGVGAPWLWYERSALSDHALSKLIRDPAVTIYTFHQGDKLVGYTEMRRQTSAEVQVLYFGLLPGFIGQGLGRYFLDWSVREAFSEQIDRLWVHTCSLDHPRALDSYKRVGFMPYRRESGWVTIPSQALSRRHAHTDSHSG